MASGALPAGLAGSRPAQSQSGVPPKVPSVVCLWGEHEFSLTATPLFVQSSDHAEDGSPLRHPPLDLFPTRDSDPLSCPPEVNPHKGDCSHAAATAPGGLPASPHTTSPRWGRRHWPSPAFPHRGSGSCTAKMPGGEAPAWPAAEETSALPPAPRSRAGRALSLARLSLGLCAGKKSSRLSHALRHILMN